jgi:hypothetical protein|tara:strand:+ start:959 stop:1966 length:1008 start_codon:yes stop_codon:yes gene_type:complete
MIYNLSNVEDYKPNITKQAILNVTTEEEIFRHYLEFDFKLGKMYHSPLREDDNPSFNLYYAPNGEMRFKDFNGEQGTCFDLVMILSGSGFNDCLKIINSDMNLGLENSYNTEEVKRVKYTNFRKNILKEKSECLIQFKPQHFTDEDIKYWEQFNIDYNILKRYNIYSSKYVFVNKKLVFTYSKNNPVYCYSLPNNKVKVYRPMSDKGKYKWLSNATNNEIQGLYQLEYDSNTLVITKSMKDVMCLRSFRIDAIAPQAETNYLNVELANNVTQKYEKIVILYDNDDAGINGASELQKILPNAKISFIPISSKCKDISEYFSKYGMEKTIELLIKII